MNMNMLMAITMSCWMLSSLTAGASKSKEEGKPTEATDHAILDTVITQEIDSRTNALRQLEETLSILDMTIDGSDRANAFANLVRQEVEYLTELKAHGTISVKLAYCRMVIGQRIDTMAFAVHYKREFGDRCEALPKVHGRTLTDAEVEVLKKKIDETMILKKKVDGITTPGTVP